MRRLLHGIFLFLMLLPALAAAQDFPPQVQKALDDLNTRLGTQLTLKDFNWRYSQNIYEDNSLGCPKPGIAYVKGNTPGYQVQLDVKGLTWDYRVSSDLSRVILCSPLATPTPTPLPTFPPPAYTPLPVSADSTATPTFCPNAPVPRLTIGLLAQVLPDFTNIVRNAPGQSGGYLGELPVGRVIYVLDGPRCASNMTWWYVADTQSHLIGWTSEGMNDPQAQMPTQYWLAPVFPEGYVTAAPIATLSGVSALITNTPGASPTATRIRPTATITLVPTMTPSPAFPMTSTTICDASVPPRMVIGAAGQVTPGIPNNLREGAGSSTKYIGEIPPGSLFTVLEGPTCASGLAWWKVNYNGIIGWTPEGQKGDYWIEPVLG
ncbi:MAG: SH3 domain-containing protein [Anaerolineaceae bacterium]|nr:SH3 domain-containing protein [Anaerolineaceae bacterium]